MQIDTEHLHHWMIAIRNSPDPMRTMDAFWRGQIKSKEWLIDNLKPFVKTPVSIDIYGGWVGTLSSMIFQSDIPVKSIRSIDIDPSCEEIANNMNKIEQLQGKFSAITGDMCATESSADLVLNTSCEHITQQQYNKWLDKVPHNSLLFLQSNNYNITEHIRIATSLEEFEQQSGINVLKKDQLILPLYTRWMLIGYKI
jgi:hypothetical protein